MNAERQSSLYFSPILCYFKREMSLRELKNRKILILGFGKEGKDSYLALRKLFAKKVLAVADEKTLEKLPPRTQKILKSDQRLKLHLGRNYLKHVKNYDLIIKTPGIPQETIKPFLKKSAKITSQTEIFFENCPGTIIGVTGTKGKGTVASLIEQILKKAGLKVYLIGNIGKPALSRVLNRSRSLVRRLSPKNEIFVYELSSHQLQNLKKSPHIAVFLNLYPAHLDYYKTFKEYQKAKENITLHQTKDDFFIFNAEQKKLRIIAQKTKAQKVAFGLSCLKGKWLCCGKEKIIQKKEIPLRGEFNVLNTMAAILASKLFNISTTTIRRAIKSFKPLPYRLEFIGKYKGIEFYNDSLATVPQASEAALEALGHKVKTLILGGEDVAGFSFSGLAEKILKSKISTLVLLPDTGKKIWKEIIALNKKDLPRAFFVSSMKEAVKIAYQTTNKRSICLLSPGSPSFNLFRDYRERGKLFNFFVKKFSHER